MIHSLPSREAQKKLHKQLLTAMKKNEDISSLLANEKNNEDVKAALTLLLFDNSILCDSSQYLLDQCITEQKVTFVKSVLTYIDKKKYNDLKEKFYSNFATKLLDNCCINMKYKEDRDEANKTINFAKKTDILNILLKEYFNNDVVEELSRKNNKQQYIYSNEIIISAFKKYQESVDTKEKLENGMANNSLFSFPGGFFSHLRSVFI